MSRKKTLHDLPPLPAERFLPAENQTARLLALLREIARECQQPEARPFYTMRDLTRHFGVTLSVVGRAYQQLEDEGLLSRIRGCGTVLQGKAARRQLKVRGFLGIPVSMARFGVDAEYQRFTIHMRRVLWDRGFAASNAFFEATEADPRVVSRRILHRGVETVIWYRPDGVARETAAFLEDKGINVIGISEGNTAPIPCRYRVNREKALRRVLDGWRREGIDHFTLARAVVGPMSNGGSAVERIMEETGTCETMRVDPRGIGSAWRHLKRDRNGGLVMLSFVAAFLAYRAPEDFAALIRSRRVLLYDGPVVLPPWEHWDMGEVDVIAVDWPQAASRILDDLIARRGEEEGFAYALDAEARMRIPLASLS